MVNGLHVSFSKNLSSWNLNWYTIFNFLIVNEWIFDNLFSINRSFDFLLSNYRSLYNSLLYHWLRNDSFIDDGLSNNSFSYFRLIYYFCGLSNCRFWIQNLSSIFNTLQNLLFCFYLSSAKVLALRVLLYLDQQLGINLNSLIFLDRRKRVWAIFEKSTNLSCC